MTDDKYVLLSDGDQSLAQKSSSRSMKSLGVIFLITMGTLSMFFCCIPSTSMTHEDDLGPHLRKEPLEVSILWDTNGFDELDDNKCMSYRSTEGCTTANKCIWCKSKIIGDRCYPVDAEKYLPKGMFDCDDSAPPNPLEVMEVSVDWTALLVEAEMGSDCGGYKSKSGCDNRKGCTWCESGAIPSKCYSSDMASKLPSGVFKCDNKAKLMDPFLDVTEKTNCNYDKSSACDSREGCIWCKSKALKSKCFTKDTAKLLPPGVFTCDHDGKVVEPAKVLDLHVNTIDASLKNSDPFVQEKLLCDPSVNQALGYFRLGQQDKHYFFWFFESRNDPTNDPVVLWMTGGPGCSSELALFVENGPCTVNKDGTDTVRNEYSWNTNANLIFIDQPAGTGFSYGTHDSNEVSVGNDMDMFVREFLKRFPKYKKSDFFVFGESYAGHYVPATAHAIYNNNKNSKDFKVNLKGIGIGNGLTDPMVQYKYYAEMAYNSGTAPARITVDQYNDMKDFTPQCIELIKDCNEKNDDALCVKAVNECNERLMGPYAMSGYNQYDMRIKCAVPGLCYDFSNIDTYLHRKEVLDYLGVAPEKRNWQSCDESAHTALMADWMKDYQDWVAELLDGAEIDVLVYAGDVDFIVNYLGCRAWPLELEWSGKKGYNEAKEYEWKVAGKEAGKLRAYKNLAFIQVYQAGHMVPMDKPRAALQMLNAFIQKKFT